MRTIYHKQCENCDAEPECRVNRPVERFPPVEPFRTVQEEQGTLVQLFHAFSVDERTNNIHDMEIHRRDWHSRRLHLRDTYSAFFGPDPGRTLTGSIVTAVAISECEYVWNPMRCVRREDLEGGG